jgi:hypothetical protein
MMKSQKYDSEKSKKKENEAAMGNVENDKI